ncbi:MAG: carbonic anhydrase [Clostridia bacterium]|nr:carbonic anhydrase [Clostridia bacterium]
MLKLQYRIKTGRKLNLNNPKRYTEKIQWYKLNSRDPVMAQCADKYLVREFVKSRGLGSILNKLYTTFDAPEEISFDNLPDSFVLKLSNGSGTNVLVRDKSSVDVEQIKKEFKSFIAQANAFAGREWVYNTDQKRTIVAEEFLQDSNQENGIFDYKFLCFDGEPYCIAYDIDRFTDHKRNIYDIEWNNLNVASDCECSGKEYARPEKLDEMLDIARKLSKGFPAVRVDLYCVNSKIYFGEMTFFPWSGYVNFEPDEFDFKLGDKFVIETNK